MCHFQQRKKADCISIYQRLHDLLSVDYRQINSDQKHKYKILLAIKKYSSRSSKVLNLQEITMFFYFQI